MTQSPGAVTNLGVGIGIYAEAKTRCRLLYLTCTEIQTLEPIILKQTSIKLCTGCGKDLTNQKKFKFESELLCEVCIEKEQKQR